jgi:hypothetical protein
VSFARGYPSYDRGEMRGDIVVISPNTNVPEELDFWIRRPW